MPLAPRICWSISGERSARSAASRARFSLVEKPIPISAVPASFMIVRTSAKSRLIKPGRVIRSQMPWTPWRSTSSAIRKASSIEVDLSSTSSSRSFGITITVSQLRRSSSTPCSAVPRRRVPSNRNGVVTIPTVSAPSSRAIRATTGAAPEPVPPPSPAVTKTMSEPRSAFLTWSYASSAARRPRSGSAPEPRPSVSSRPMWIFTGASLIWSCWMSVLTATNSTCETSASIIRLTAFRPAPPTPTTRMTAMYAPGSGTRCRRGGGSGSGSRFGRSRAGFGFGSGRAADGGSAGSGSGAGSGLRSGRRTGSGFGFASSTHSGTCSTVCSGGSAGLACVGLAWVGPACFGLGTTGASRAASSSVLPSFSACRCAASVARNSSASGPSRMLARLRAIEHLLRKLSVGLRGIPARVVLQDGGALHRGLRIANGLADLRVEDEISEVLLQDLDGLARVQRPAVEHRRQDPLDLDDGVQVLPDHRERVLELDQAAQREVLALHRDDHARRRDQRVDREQPERWGRVDQDVVVGALDLREGLLQCALAPDHARERELGSGKVDRRDREVDLGVMDDLLDRQAVDQHVEDRALHRVGIQALAHRQVPLRIQVDEQHLQPVLRERDAEVQGRRRLHDAALLVGERDHARHRRLFGGLSANPRSRKQACKPHRVPSSLSC